MNIAEVKHDIETFQHRIQNPGSLSQQQIEQYKISLRAAQNMLQKLQPQGQSQEQTQHQPQQQSQQPAAARRREMLQPNTQQKPSATPPPLPLERGPGGEVLRTLIVNLPGTGTPEVQIQWSDKEPETLTEGQALSRFKSCLRDLIESKLYQEERYSQLPNYLSWHRATGYYQALTHFWQRPPSAEEINLSRAVATRHIFGLIQTASQT